MRTTERRRRSAGFTLVEILIAVAIIAIVAFVALYGISSTGKALSVQRQTQTQTSNLENTVDRMFSSANSSDSIYLPSSCGGTGAADGVSCSQVRFYGKDSSGVAHFWGWNYDAAAQTLTEYRDLPSADSALTTATPVVSLANVTAFSAIPQNATYWASVLGLSGVSANESHVLGSTLDPNDRVYGGNRTVLVDITTSMAGTRDAVLLSHDATFSEDVVNFQVETPQVSTSLVCNTPSCDLNFANAGSPAQTATFTDANFGQYLPYIGSVPPWNASSCTNAYGVTVATIGLTSNSGDSYSATVDPKYFGMCTFTVTNYAGVSVTETINVGGNAGDSLGLNPGNVTLPVDSSQSGSFSEAGPILSGNYAAFPYGSGSQGANTTCDPQYVATTISGPNFGISTVGKTPVTSVTNCQIVYYDTDYDPSNPYTSNLIYVEQVTLLPPPAPTPDPATAVPASLPTTVPSGPGSPFPIPLPPAPPASPPSQVTLPPVPIPTAPAVAACGSLNSYGDPTNSFVPPPYEAGVPVKYLYGAVSAPSQNSQFSEQRVPNGNTLYGYFDDWNGVPAAKTDGTKGSFLMSENTDCTVTVVFTSESIHEYIKWITFSLEFRNVYGGHPVDSIDETGGTNQGYCAFTYQDGYDGHYSDGLNGFLMENAPQCANSAVGSQVTDQSAPALTGFTPRIEDYVLVPLPTGRVGPDGYGEVAASRIVMYPSDLLSIIPVPTFFHSLLRGDGTPFTYADGTGEYGTGPSALYANPVNATAGGLYRSASALGQPLTGPTPQPETTPPPPPVMTHTPYPVPTVKPVPCFKDPECGVGPL